MHAPFAPSKHAPACREITVILTPRWCCSHKPLPNKGHSLTSSKQSTCSDLVNATLWHSKGNTCCWSSQAGCVCWLPSTKSSIWSTKAIRNNEKLKLSLLCAAQRRPAQPKETLEKRVQVGGEDSEQGKKTHSINGKLFDYNFWNFNSSCHERRIFILISKKNGYSRFPASSENTKLKRMSKIPLPRMILLMCWKKCSFRTAIWENNTHHTESRR